MPDTLAGVPCLCICFTAVCEGSVRKSIRRALPDTMDHLPSLSNAMLPRPCFLHPLALYAEAHAVRTAQAFTTALSTAGNATT